jgi:hypothetical protein
MPAVALKHPIGPVQIAEHPQVGETAKVDECLNLNTLSFVLITQVNQ